MNYVLVNAQYYRATDVSEEEAVALVLKGEFVCPAREFWEAVAAEEERRLESKLQGSNILCSRELATALVIMDLGLDGCENV